ncbi:MAG: hypothetical protein GXN95_00055 [Methanococci archaeon]|nr:hypothetical protein [Methanococci archaeon]
MALKDNLYYWNISLKHPEPVVDKYYILDKVIANDENLIKKVERLRELIISYCVVIEKDKTIASKILDEIFNIITTTDKIQYTEFVAFWKVLDLSHSIFKQLPDKKIILENILKEYCKRRRKLYDNLGYSNIVVQALYDNGTSRKKGNSGILKIKDIIQNTIGNIPKARSVEDIKHKDIVYILPDSGDRELFLQFLKEFNIKFKFGKDKQNKAPDFLLKFVDHVFIIEAKHLKEPGGEQNKSINELIDFIKQREENPNIHYISFLDGLYFNLLINPIQSKNRKKNKIQKQREDIENTLKTYKSNFFVNTYGFLCLLDDLKSSLNPNSST